MLESGDKEEIPLEEESDPGKNHSSSKLILEFMNILYYIFSYTAVDQLIWYLFIAILQANAAKKCWNPGTRKSFL